MYGDKTHYFTASIEKVEGYLYGALEVKTSL